jgi:hypothetical protein
MAAGLSGLLYGLAGSAHAHVTCNTSKPHGTVSSQYGGRFDPIDR